MPIDYLQKVQDQLEIWCRDKVAELNIRLDFDFVSAKTGNNIDVVFTKIGKYVWDFRESMMISKEYRNSPGYDYGHGDTYSPRSIMQNVQRADGMYMHSMGSYNGTDMGGAKSYGNQGILHKQDCCLF